MTREEHLSAIKQADHEYYDLDNPSMSDAEYDSLRRSYIEQYGSEDLDYVPGDISDGFEKFKHPTPVTSLGKWTKGVDSEDDFKKKIEELWPVEIQPKYDGLTVVAYPQPDGSYKYVTRGLGGEIGEVLPNFIPKYEQARAAMSGAPMRPVRGEVFITPANFERLNSALEADGEEPMKNMRNAAAGLLRRKDRSPYLNLLSYIVYDLPGVDATPAGVRHYISNYTDFEVTDSYAYDTPEETIKGIEQVYNDIVSLQTYPIDGIVIKSCQEGSLAKFGSVRHHNKNAFAYKASQEEVETVVRDVIWQMGRSKATPVAIVDPVQIDGTTVTKASLHNAAEIERLGLKIGATVKIRKANQIIPQITEVIKPGVKDIVLDVCPACGGPLEEVNGQQFCINPDCSERIAQNIAFLGKKEVLDINGLSIETARKLVTYWKENHPGESFNQNILFRTSVKDFEQLEGFGEKSALKIRQAIVRRQANVELPRFIKALCIPGIGNDIGKKLADHFGSLENMEEELDPSKNYLGYEKLKAIKGVGPVVAEKIACDDAFWNAADALKQYITIAPYQKEESVVVGEFVGKTFVLTGKMEHPRSYYEELIAKAGAKTGSSVSKTTDYLVIADVNSTSSKAKKARELGTKLISPEELEEMLG